MMFRSICLMVVLVLGVVFHQVSGEVCKANLCSLEDAISAQNKAVTAQFKSLKQTVADLESKIEKSCSAPVQTCPPGFVYRSAANSCYKVILQSLTWDQAQARCGDLHPGAHLAAVTNAEKNKAIYDLITSFSAAELQVCKYPSYGPGFFVGARRPGSGSCTYEWKRNSAQSLPMTYTNWHTGEPNGCSAGENCIHYWENEQYQWNDVTCTVGQCAICEVDK